MTFTKRTLRDQLLELIEHARGDGRGGALEVLLDHLAQLDRVGLGELFEADHAHVAARLEGALLVEDVRDAAAHAGGEVAAGGPEDDDAPAGHVLAAVVADALHDGGRAGVADGEALAREPAEERLARGRAVEDGVADDDVVLGAERLGSAFARAHREHAAGEALAGVVVRVAVEREGDAGGEPAAEALARGAFEGDVDRVRRRGRRRRGRARCGSRGCRRRSG